jgi:predicted anti-sigma-YlaC factor YlaD
MSNLLEKALMELSDGSREEMTDLARITKHMSPCPNCRVLLPPDATQHVCVMEIIALSRVGNI